MEKLRTSKPRIILASTLVLVGMGIFGIVIWQDRIDGVSVNPTNNSTSLDSNIDAVWEEFIKQKQTELKQEGFVELAQTFRASLDGSSEHGVTILYKRETFPEGFIPDESILEVYRVQKDGVQKLGEYETEGNMVVFDELNGTDINGDGKAELIIREGNGGNCRGCSRMKIFHVSDEILKQVPIQITEKDDFVPKRLEDVNNDGVFEVLALHTPWECAFGIGCAGSPVTWGIYKWNGNEYIEASQEFPEFYEDMIQRSLQFSPHLGNIISILLHRIQMGEAAEGWKQFQQRMASLLIDENRKETIVKELQEFYDL